MSVREKAYLLTLAVAALALMAGVTLWGAILFGLGTYVAFVVDRTLAKKAEEDQDTKTKVDYALLKSTAVPRWRLP